MRAYLEMARESTDKLNTLVDDLLDLSKFSAGHMRLNFEITHLDELVRTCFEKYGAAFAERGLDVQFEATARADFRVLIDPVRVSQVLNNLFTNAAKYAPKGGKVR